jgi:hypothetical protein
LKQRTLCYQTDASAACGVRRAVQNHGTFPNCADNRRSTESLRRSMKSFVTWHSDYGFPRNGEDSISGASHLRRLIPGLLSLDPAPAFCSICRRILRKQTHSLVRCGVRQKVIFPELRLTILTSDRQTNPRH